MLIFHDGLIMFIVSMKRETRSSRHTRRERFSAHSMLYKNSVNVEIMGSKGRAFSSFQSEFIPLRDCT